MQHIRNNRRIIDSSTSLPDGSSPRPQPMEEGFNMIDDPDHNTNDDRAAAPKPSRFDLALGWFGLALVCINLIVGFAYFAYQHWSSNLPAALANAVLMVASVFCSYLLARAGITAFSGGIDTQRATSFDLPSGIAIAVGGAALLLGSIVLIDDHQSRLAASLLATDGVLLIIISVYHFRNVRRYRVR